MNPPAVLAPFSQEAEQSVLGAVMVNPDAYHPVALFLKADDFFLTRNQHIWKALTRLAERRTPFDFVTVQDELSNMGCLEDIGGAGYLLTVVNSVPTSVHAEVYGRLVQRAAVRRRLLRCADEFKALALDTELSLEKVLGDAEKRFTSVRDTSLEDDSEKLATVVARMMGEVEQRMIDPGKPTGILTGYKDWDDVTGGLHAPDLTIIAARPGMGKTALMLNIAMNAARCGARVGFASQEMDRNQLVYRLAAMESGLNQQLIKQGRLDEKQWSRFVKAAGEIAKLPITIDDANRLTPMMLRTKALRWRNHHGLDLLMVDYLQILSSGGAFKQSERVQEVGYFARELKQLSRELRIPVIAAAQLSRSLENREDKRPQLSDLRESGEIEQEADLVHFIYRDAVYNDATEFPNRAEIITSKHRNGATGSIALHFEKSTTRFSDMHSARIDLTVLKRKDIDG